MKEIALQKWENKFRVIWLSMINDSYGVVFEVNLNWIREDREIKIKSRKTSKVNLRKDSELTVNSHWKLYSLSFSRIYFEFTIFFTLNSLSSLRIHCQFTIFSRIHFQCFLLFYFDFPIFANWTRNQHLFREFNSNSLRKHYLFREITLNSLYRYARS